MSSFEREYRDSVTRSFNRGIQIEQVKEDLNKELIFRAILTNGREKNNEDCKTAKKTISALEDYYSNEIKYDYFKLYSYTETAVKMLIDEVVKHYMHVFKDNKACHLSSRRYRYIDEVVSSLLFDQEYPEKGLEI